MRPPNRACDELDGNPPIEVVIPATGRFAGVYVQAISAYAPHPNAAKVFADYLMTPEGFTPWSSDIGIYAGNRDVEHHPQDNPWEWWESRLWTYDPDFAVRNRGIVLDTWIRNVSK